MKQLAKLRVMWIVWLALLVVVAGCVQTPEREPEATIVLPTAAPLATVPIANVTPSIHIAPESGEPGTAVTIWGEGWWPGGVVQVGIDDLGDEAAPPIYASAEADADGRFTAALVIPLQQAWKSLPVVMITAESRAVAQHAAVPFTLVMPAATPVTPTATNTVPPTPLQPEPTATNTVPPVPTNTLPPATVTPLPPMATPTSTTAPLPTAVPTVVINNWRGEYYGNPTLSGQPALVRDDVAINFFWGDQAPAVGLPADAFSARWTRTVYLEGGQYRFYAASDDGVRVWLDGTIIIDQWHSATGSTYQQDQAVTAGNHTFRVEYYEDRGAAHVWFWWEKVGVYPDWRGEYWDNDQLAGPPALLRNDTNLNFNWGQGAPGNGLPADHFSARWTRDLTFTEDLYRFTLTVDDGARLYVDGQLVIDEWRIGPTRTVTADKWLAGGTHNLRLEYFENTGQALVALSWQRPTYFPDWKGEYWTNQNLQGAPAVIRNDAQVDFNWLGNAPAEGIPADHFSARWTRTIHFNDGRYRLYAIADDGIRVYIEGRLLIDEWHDSSGDVIYQVETTLSSDDRVVIEYYNNTGNGRVRFWYERIGDLPTYTPTPPPTPQPTLPVSTPMLRGEE